jgi:hypothetical protein
MIPLRWLIRFLSIFAISTVFAITLAQRNTQNNAAKGLPRDKAALASKKPLVEGQLKDLAGRMYGSADKISNQFIDLNATALAPAPGAMAEAFSKAQYAQSISEARDAYQAGDYSTTIDKAYDVVSDVTLKIITRSDLPGAVHAASKDVTSLLVSLSEFQKQSSEHRALVEQLGEINRALLDVDASRDGILIDTELVGDAPSGNRPTGSAEGGFSSESQLVSDTPVGQTQAQQSSSNNAGFWKSLFLGAVQTYQQVQAANDLIRATNSQTPPTQQGAGQASQVSSDDWSASSCSQYYAEEMKIYQPMCDGLRNPDFIQSCARVKAGMLQDIQWNLTHHCSHWVSQGGLGSSTNTSQKPAAGGRP